MICVYRWALVLCVALLPSVASAEDKFFNADGVQIRYVEQGSGEPIILIHGFLVDLDVWIRTDVVPNLAKDHRVIALDCRGHGRSDKPHDPKQYGPQMALDIVRLLDHLGLHKAHIVGYSMGAHITAHLLTMHPERFLTATLGGAPGLFHWSAEDDRRAEVEASELEQGMLRSQILRLSPPNEPKPTDEEIGKRSEAMLAGKDRVALAAVRRSSRDLVVAHAQMAAVVVPTLGIVGSADPYLTDFTALKQAMPQLKLVVIEGATHSPPRGAVRRPEFVQAIRDFSASTLRTSDR